MEQFMSALNDGLGDVPIDMVVDLQEFLKLTLDLPDEVFVDGEIDADETDPEAMGEALQDQFEEGED